MHPLFYCADNYTNKANREISTMDSITVIITLFLSVLSSLVEKITDYFSSGVRRKDVERKIKELEEQRNKALYYHIRNIRSHSTYEALNKSLGSELTHKIIIDTMLKNDEVITKWQQLDYLVQEDSKLDKLTYEELRGFILIERTMRERLEAKKKNKNETVVNLFLLSEKNKMLKTKTISVLTMILSAVAVAFLGLPIWTMCIGLVIFLLAELKDQIVSFRVSRGFFGTTTSEAIQLIKFIRENSDKFDSNNGDGRRRKILNPERLNTKGVKEADGGLQNV